jgi:predicted permease
MTRFWQDARYALRMLRKAPMLTAIVVLTLALGIGANITIFGVVNGLLLRPLPVKSPEQIMVLAAVLPGDVLGVYQFSYREFADFQKQAGSSFSDLLATQIDLGGLSVGGRATQFLFARVSGNYFSDLGVQPALGQMILPTEGKEGGKDAYVVLGYTYWQKRFGGDPEIVGKQALLDGQEATIIGVAPKQFHGTMFAVDMDGYVPLNMQRPAEAAGFWSDRGDRVLNILGRLKPGVSLSQAQSTVNVIAARLAEEYPATDKGVTFRVIPERLARPSPMAKNVVPLVAGLFLALAGLVLLLACMNVANILLVRATIRQREMAIRAAMGANRVRLIRQLMTESVVMAFFGGLGGVLLGQRASALIVRLLPQNGLPIRMDFSFDWNVFWYALGAALLTAVVVGVWPALRAGRANVNDVLHGSGRSDTGGVGKHRVRSVLVVAQVAGSLVLLIMAGLFVRSLVSAQHAFLGFDPNNVLNVTLGPRGVGYDETRTKNFYKELETRARTLPGVESVSSALVVPMGVGGSVASVFVEGRPLNPGEQPPTIADNQVDSGYFETMRVPLLRGRAFRETDDEKAPLVAIVNETMAKQFWPGEEAIGKRFSTKGASGPFAEVVGIVPDGKYVFIGLDKQPYFFVPLAQAFSSYRTLQLRTTVPPATLSTQVQELVRELDANVPISNVQTMMESLNGPNGFYIFQIGAILAGAMGLLGLTLAVVGVYGVVSFAAAQRTREIGIRLALGAERRDILRMVLKQGLVLVIGGVAAGLALALVLTRAMGVLLLGVSPRDAVTFGAATLVLGGIGLWACYAPARRAMKVDPMVALRYE